MLIQNGDKLLAVVFHLQMRQFVQQDVVQAGEGLLGELQVEADCPGAITYFS